MTCKLFVNSEKEMVQFIIENNNQQKRKSLFML